MPLFYLEKLFNVQIKCSLLLNITLYFALILMMLDLKSSGYGSLVCTLLHSVAAAVPASFVSKDKDDKLTFISLHSVGVKSQIQAPSTHTA